APSASGLTPRQREVLLLMVQGFGTRAIAGKLSLSVKTIETHRARLMARLGIRDVPGLVRFAVRNGLVPPDF
ncbi:MAG: response regulator transcription factor, partial [Gemmatimonadales bacterium]